MVMTAPAIHRAIPKAKSTCAAKSGFIILLIRLLCKFLKLPQPGFCNIGKDEGEKKAAIPSHIIKTLISTPGKQ